MSVHQVVLICALASPVILLTCLGLIARHAAHRRGRRAWPWVLGVLAFPPVLAAMFCLPPRRPATISRWFSAPLEVFTSLASVACLAGFGIVLQIVWGGGSLLEPPTCTSAVVKHTLADAFNHRPADRPHLRLLRQLQESGLEGKVRSCTGEALLEDGSLVGFDYIIDREGWGGGNVSIRHSRTLKSAPPETAI